MSNRQSPESPKDVNQVFKERPKAGNRVGVLCYRMKPNGDVDERVAWGYVVDVRLALVIVSIATDDGRLLVPCPDEELVRP